MGSVLARFMPCCVLVMILVAQAHADTRVDAETLRRAAPGTVLRVWPLEGGIREGVKGYKVLYRSTGLRDEPVAVTGAVIFSATRVGTGVRPVIAWAHPTTGVARHCAPTLLPGLGGSIQGLDYMIDKDYVVVATDYVGLGTDDHHPYLVGVSAGRAILDSVRAARHLRDTFAGHRFAVWGHSQGGHAALFSAQMTANYAPELELMGVAAAAPATHLAQLFEADRDTPSGRSLTSMALLSWSKVFDFRLEDYVEERARIHFSTLASDCIQSIADFFKEEADERALERNFLKVNPSDHPVLRSIMDENSPGTLPDGTRVFLAQGTDDNVVRPQVTRKYMDQICQSGAIVRLHVIDGGGHMFAGRDSSYEAVTWMAALFEGGVLSNDC